MSAIGITTIHVGLHVGYAFILYLLLMAAFKVIVADCDSLVA